MTAAIIRRRWRRRWTRSAGCAAFRERQRAARDEGRYLGLGLGCYVEGTGVGPFESALVRIDPRARFSSPPAPVRKARAWRRSLPRSSPMPGSVHPDDVVDFARRYRRRSPSASARSRAAPRSRCRRPFTAPAKSCAPKCLPSPPICWNARRAISNCATAASALSACRAPKCRSPRWRRRRGRAGINGRPPGVDAGLEETYYFEPPTVTWSYAVHAAVVEVDAETGHVTHRELRHRARLRRGGQSDAGRGPDRRRRRAGHRRRVVRSASTTMPTGSR